MPGYTYNTAAAVTQRNVSYSGKGMLTAELLAAFVFIGIRVVADFEVSEGGEVKGNVLHKQGQLGPMSILAGLIGSFFILSFLAAAGGTKSKLAVIFGGIIVLGLGIKSLPEIEFVAGTIGKIGSVVVPPASGSPEGVLGGTAGAGAGAAVPLGQQPGKSPANTQNAAGNSLTAGNRAIGSIQSPFTADVLKGNLLGIPVTVGKDVVSLGKAVTDYINSLFHI